MLLRHGWALPEGKWMVMFPKGVRFVIIRCCNDISCQNVVLKVVSFHG